ncbi:hypothetical protein Tco_0073091 [Tanacetum coccineum]
MSTEMLLAKEKLIKAIQTYLKNNNQPPEEKSIAILRAEEDLQTLGNTSNQLKQEEQDSSQYWKPPVYYSDDDDDSYRESIDETPPSDAITSDLPITDSLVMEDEHLETIPKTDSDEEIESSIFSNPLFDSNDNYTSSDDESSFEEDVPVENFKIYSNPLLEFDEEIFSSEINPLYNEVLEDLDSIPPGIAETNFNPKEDICLIKELLYDNSSPRPPEELNSENDFEKENSGSTAIHTDISLPEYESFDNESDSAFEIFNDDLAHIISPSEYEYVYADDESDSGDLTTDVVERYIGRSKESSNVYISWLL